MEKDKHIKLLQLTYASVLADATAQFGQEGVLENVEARKRREQLEAGAIVLCEDARYRVRLLPIPTGRAT